jgi:16S rRNA (cytidine1402-2'-O)-methyltransferase
MLYVVATPIGNLGDITLRALEVLKGVDVVAAEDTRHSGLLLKHFEIKSPLSATTNIMKRRARLKLVERLARGENVSVDYRRWHAGLSDPGLRLIRECIIRELPFTIVPGPSSIPTALLGSGFSTERFSFRGFLPVKSGRRERELRIAAEREETTLFFESPYRLLKTLQACISHYAGRQLCIARELTKKFEEFRRGTACRTACTLRDTSGERRNRARRLWRVAGSPA